MNRHPGFLVGLNGIIKWAGSSELLSWFYLSAEDKKQPLSKMSIPLWNKVLMQKYKKRQKQCYKIRSGIRRSSVLNLVQSPHYRNQLKKQPLSETMTLFIWIIRNLNPTWSHPWYEADLSIYAIVVCYLCWVHWIYLRSVFNVWTGNRI